MLHCALFKLRLVTKLLLRRVKKKKRKINVLTIKMSLSECCLKGSKPLSKTMNGVLTMNSTGSYTLFWLLQVPRPLSLPPPLSLTHKTINEIINLKILNAKCRISPQKNFRLNARDLANVILFYLICFSYGLMNGEPRIVCVFTMWSSSSI